MSQQDPSIQINKPEKARAKQKKHKKKARHCNDALRKNNTFSRLRTGFFVAGEITKSRSIAVIKGDFFFFLMGSLRNAAERKSAAPRAVRS